MKIYIETGGSDYFVFKVARKKSFAIPRGSCLSVDQHEV